MTHARILFAGAVCLLAFSCSESPPDGGPGGGGASSGGRSTGSGSSLGSGGTGGGLGGDTSTGGSVEPGDFFGVSRCAGGDFLLCDGFESTAIDTERWKIEKWGDSNVVEVTEEFAARGAKSVHFHAVSGASAAYIKTTAIFPVADNTYYGRMFLRVKSYATQVDYAHWTVIEAAGKLQPSDTQETAIRVGGQYSSGKNYWGVGTDHGPTGDWTNNDNDPTGAPVPPPTNTWTCLEWLHSGADDTTKLFIDGIEHPSLATDKRVIHYGGDQTADYLMPEFSSVAVGWWQYQAAPESFDVWVDEVALDDERIGCDR